MNELSVHPNVYATGRSRGLLAMLETLWLREQQIGDGTMYIVSGFANYNGGVRFYPVFRDHVRKGGKVVAVFAGSARQKLTSRQVVAALLECGVEVHIVNRKRLMHVKSCGAATSTGQLLVVTSGNFTGPGMAQNVEMAVLLDRPSTKEMGFSWNELVAQMFDQGWSVSQPELGNASPAWQLLYDEKASTVVLEETDEVTMALRLGPADTARINATPGTNEAKGTQYFWLSKDCYDFFPPLTILNRRGRKRTYSAEVRVYFADLQQTSKVRVTFEAENNLDFRLGTGPLRGTGMAASGDWVALSRTGESRYELRLYRHDDPVATVLGTHAVHSIGQRSKRYGFLSNDEFQVIAGVRLGLQSSP